MGKLISDEERCVCLMLRGEGAKEKAGLLCYLSRFNDIVMGHFSKLIGW